MNHLLDPLEVKWRATFNTPPLNTPPLSIGGAQFFAWDQDPSGEGVVVCIGSNYSQYPTQPHLPTRTNLRKELSNYKFAAQQIRGSWQSDWRAHRWLVGNLPPSHPRYFVMSNLVPWITSKEWTRLPKAQTHQAIALARTVVPGHLDDLAQALPDAFAIGHGINHRTLPYLQIDVSKWKDWMLYANLTYRQTPSRWDATCNRFKF